MKRSWWKIVSLILLVYTVFGGFVFEVPRLAIVNETIRGLYFHVPMWFAMITMFFISAGLAIAYLRNPSVRNDVWSVEFANAGLIFGILGIVTGMVWATFTWGTFWHGDPKQNGAAITLLIYLAYFVLRGSVQNNEQRARLSAVYNIFAFAAMIPLLFVIPRLQDSMHPGSGGNPGFNMYDLDHRMRPVFYAACLGWILLSGWIATLRIRMRTIEEQINERDDERDS